MELYSCPSQAMIYEILLYVSSTLATAGLTASFNHLTIYTVQNWPQSKKVLIFGILSLAAFAGLASALANQLGFVVQGRLYHKTPVEISYSVGT